MAKTKTGKTTKGSRQPRPKYLGVKIYGGQKAKAGNIIVRQKGAKYRPGKGVCLGRDFTLYAVNGGEVKFYERRGKKYVGISASA